MISINSQSRQSIAPRTSLTSSAPPSSSANDVNKNQIQASRKQSIITTTTNKTVTEIVTSKEWVLPPRPKPGRKPSIDTPATKRKAQNRAAQRAFRERRATRVQELEAKLNELEMAKESREVELIGKINKIFLENQYLVKKVEILEKDLLKYKNGNMIRPHQQISPISSPNTDNSHGIEEFNNDKGVTNANNNDNMNNNNGSSILDDNDDDNDCGICIKDDCVCEASGIKISKKIEEAINTFKPMAAVSIKKRKLSGGDEIDFTRKFSKFHSSIPSQTQSQQQYQQIDIPADTNDSPGQLENCGFCSDDTPCVCREANEKQQEEKEEQQQKSALKETEISNLPPIQRNSIINEKQLPVLHPGPSVEIREISNLNINYNSTPASPIRSTPIPVVPQQKKKQEKEPQSMECTGNPGTCFQCQVDPMSTLFCTTIANKESTTQEKPPRPIIRPTKSTTNSTSTNNGEMFIPCADAYKTLSRHKEFNSIDFNTLVGKLTTKGMQVEVQSVANLLRELDRKLYN